MNMGVAFCSAIGFAAMAQMWAQFPSNNTLSTRSNASYVVSAAFDDVGPLTVSSPVRMGGFKLGYVYELARAGKIKSLRQGKYTRFTEAAVLEYIAGNGSAANLGTSNMLSSGVDTDKQFAYGVVHEPRRVQKRPQHHRSHANGAGAPPGRPPADRQPLGARILADP